MEEQTCNPDTSGSWPLMNDLTMASPTRPCANCWLMESPTNNMFRSVHAVVVKFCIRSSEMEGGNGGNNSGIYVTSSESWRRNDIRTSQLQSEERCGDPSARMNRLPPPMLPPCLAARRPRDSPPRRPPAPAAAEWSDDAATSVRIDAAVKIRRSAPIAIAAIGGGRGMERHCHDGPQLPSRCSVLPSCIGVSGAHSARACGMVSRLTRE